MNSPKARMFVAALILSATLIAPGRATEPPKERAYLPIADGPFKGTDESLRQYKCPDWFRDAKLGIWAVWGPESVPMQGDWYARQMYVEGGSQYKYHLEHYGHPSKFGFKDIIPLWKAEKWDPDRLMALYKKAGAKYFCVIAQHHDNFDCWDSRFHEWNSVKMGPRRDVAGEWKKAAVKHGLRFGVTEHLGNSYSWFSPNKGADKKGPYAGVPYDGNDPQWADLYHPGNAKAKGWYDENAPTWFKVDWYNRIKDLVDKYQPDLLYSDGGLPYDEYGQSLVAHFYNQSIKQHGKLEAVYNCKEGAQNRWVIDMERGVMDDIHREPWQTDTCVGGWYYKTGFKYKSTDTVIDMLVDIVSKNGNLLLNLPPRPDGTLDDEELKILDGMAEWIAVNGEAIYGTRPWRIYGERTKQVKTASFNEDGLKFSEKDIRFTTKGDTLYAFCLGVPETEVTIKSLGKSSPQAEGEVRSVRLLGHDGKLDWTRSDAGLTIKLPEQKPCQYALAFEITGLDTKPATGLVRPRRDGSLKLEPATAELHGAKLQVENRGGHPSIGYWDNPKEYVTWSRVQFPKAGTYEIGAETSSANGPTEFVVEAAGRQVTAKVPGTADWEQFKKYSVGKIEISKADEAVVTARPRDAAKWRAIGLAGLTLKIVE